MIEIVDMLTQKKICSSIKQTNDMLEMDIDYFTYYHWCLLRPRN